MKQSKQRPTPKERRIVEREFEARQEVAAKRRRFACGVAIVGLVAGVVAAALREFHVHTAFSLLLLFIWLICIVTYVGVGVLPGSFSKDMDPRWHLNPWQEALGNLSQGKTQTEAIALLAGPVLARMLFSFLYFGLK